MAHKLFSLVLMLVLALPVVIFAFAGDESKAPAPAEVMQKQIADAIKVYGEKNEVYRKDVLDLFEKKEKNARDKGDVKTFNLIKKEKDAFFENGKEPTLFFVTDQKRFLELAKLDLIKAYEKTIKDCLKMKLDVEVEVFSKELEEIRAGKINAEIKVEEKKAKPIFLEAPFSAVAAKTAKMELAKSLGKLMESKIDLDTGVKLEMVLIPAGKFMMGGPGKDHEVTLTKPYYMGKYEVTQEQWQAVMGNNPSRAKGAKLPVTNVSRDDSLDYIRKLNAKTIGGFRLPTGAEWEYACRAGTTTAYSFGDSITKGDANYATPSPKLVGSYKPNAFGIYDMHGNIHEWCEDWYANYPAGALTDPTGPATGGRRVLRGFAFGFPAARLVSSSRENLSPPERYKDTGFRLARTP
ncbi:MAG: formylglycine-generating enzyme family protein [Planctomycetota bacterium]|nr:formylglycine-generating enzyme family protein [Planctomycetota bacterium]